MKSVFISYSYQDYEAQQIAQFLRQKLPSIGAEPIGVFSDVEIGSDWQMHITELINKCSIFICFVKKENPTVMFELGYALAKNKKIIVVGEARDLPSDLRSMTYVPRESHPFDILMYVEKYLTSESDRMPSYDIDIRNPGHTIEMLLDRPELLDNLGPMEFENLIEQWFLTHGYHVENATASRDYGYDFLISPFRGNRAVVEVKKYKSTSQVPLSVIRQLVGSMTMEQIPYGIVISTAPFTKSVNFFVEDIRQTIFLWTLEDLARMEKMSASDIETPTNSL